MCEKQLKSLGQDRSATMGARKDEGISPRWRPHEGTRIRPGERQVLMASSPEPHDQVVVARAKGRVDATV